MGLLCANPSRFTLKRGGARLTHSATPAPPGQCDGFLPGFVTLTASAFVDHSSGGLTGNWDARTRNLPSIAEAKKVGFRNVETYSIFTTSTLGMNPSSRHARRWCARKAGVTCQRLGPAMNHHVHVLGGQPDDPEAPPLACGSPPSGQPTHLRPRVRVSAPWHYWPSQAHQGGTPDRRRQAALPTALPGQG